MIDREKAFRFKEDIFSKISDEDIIRKYFLRPFQVQLRTEYSDRNNIQARHSGLPQGLFIAAKEKFEDNKYETAEFSSHAVKKKEQQYRAESKIYTLKDNRIVQKQIKTAFRGKNSASIIEQHSRNLIRILQELNNTNVIEIWAGNDVPNEEPSEESASVIHDNGRKQIVNLPTNHHLEIAICVCMYSESKAMLKDTLAGIEQNIISLVQKEYDKVKQDQIAVFVIFDGIEKMDQSVVKFFGELQENQFKINEKEIILQSMDSQFSQYMGCENIENEYDNHRFKELYKKFKTKILYNMDELFDRSQRSFPKVYSQYMNNIKMLQNIREMINRKFKDDEQTEITYDQLPPIIQKNFFLKIARRREIEKYKHNRMLIQKASGLSDRQIELKYAYFDKKLAKVIVNEALIEAQKEYTMFVKSRQDLAYLATHRVRIKNYQSEQEEQIDLQLPSQNLYMNLFLCVKYKNQGKLSSHNWFFNGFCKQLLPRYTVLLDVGLKSQPNAIYNMYHQMNMDPQIGGVCGYMGLKIQKTADEDDPDVQLDCISDFCSIFVDIQRTQQVEYHFAHLIDKPFEALFGFIHVLPGAFSAYNMNAITDVSIQKKRAIDKKSHQNIIDGHLIRRGQQDIAKNLNISRYFDYDQNLLASYFSSIQDKTRKNKIIEFKITLIWLFLKILLPDVINECLIKIDPDSDLQMLCDENMNLAEDRILCMGIHTKGYRLLYLPDAYSEVDPIKSLHALFGQRKRWINGSFFAFEKVKDDFNKYERSSQKCQLFLRLQMLYITFTNAISYFSVSFFMFTVHLTMMAIQDTYLMKLFQPNVNYYFTVHLTKLIDLVYILLIIGVIFYSISLNYTQKTFKKFLYFASTILGLMSLVISGLLISDIILGFMNVESKLPYIFLTSEDDIEAAKEYSSMALQLRIVTILVFLIHGIPIAMHFFLYAKPKMIAEMIIGVLSYIFYNPTYLILLNIYALCRVDDISWGTKGINSQQNEKSVNLRESWKTIKNILVIKYLSWNIALSIYLIWGASRYENRVITTYFIMVIIFIILAFKIVLGMFYLCHYKAKIVKRVVYDAINHHFVFENIKSEVQAKYALDTRKESNFSAEIINNISKLMEPSILTNDTV